MVDRKEIANEVCEKWQSLLLNSDNTNSELWHMAVETNQIYFLLSALYRMNRYDMLDKIMDALKHKCDLHSSEYILPVYFGERRSIYRSISRLIQIEDNKERELWVSAYLPISREYKYCLESMSKLIMYYKLEYPFKGE